MAQRTVALCEGRYIGIETIYTVINGQRINKPDKLKEVREKSRQNKLFCPCGCGTNLILVAGDRNKREQHFREKPGTGNYECEMHEESKLSIDSKIVLHCWLDDKLKVDDIESRVPISKVEDMKRKPEFTFLSLKKKFAIRYWRTRLTLLDDKLDILEGNLSEIETVYILDASNGGTNGQYPEALMKIQDRQRFCMLLSVKDEDYNKASMKVVFYDKDIDGFWKEILLAEGKLNDFSIIDNKVVYGANTLEQMLLAAKARFMEEQNAKKRRREEQEQRIREIEERRLQEELRLQEEAEKRIQQQRAEQEAKKREDELREAKAIAEKQQELKRKLEPLEAKQMTKQEAMQKGIMVLDGEFEEQILVTYKHDFEQDLCIVLDELNKRLIKCEKCGAIKKEWHFFSYGGKSKTKGICTNCHDKR